jgi:predicted transcriptional regulator
MQSQANIRKSKIILSEYPYEKDIRNRLFLSQLSLFEVSLLQEILHHSLKFSVNQLAEEMECSLDQLLPAIDKLSHSGLFKRANMTIEVDKEMRKFFEFQIQKFDEDFRPDLEFLLSALNLLPIQLLPNWYAIPRTSDHIFSSIIERYLLTPKLYQQYLNELSFDEPILHGIVKDVLRLFPQQVTASFLKEKYQIDSKTFEEYLLLLEYHFVCCLSYQKKDAQWVEVVTPIAEWADYLMFEKGAKPQKIVGAVKSDLPKDFNFIKEFITLMHAVENTALTPDWLAATVSSTVPPAMFNWLVEKLLQVKVVQSDEARKISLTAKGRRWLAKSENQLIRDLSNDPLNTMSNASQFGQLWNVKNLKLVEKSLSQLKPGEWIEFDQFFSSFTEPLADREPITLKKKGKKWKYSIPSYQNHEKEFVKAVLFERLLELAIIATGSYKGIPCFCVTEFGAPFVLT